MLENFSMYKKEESSLCLLEYDKLKLFGRSLTSYQSNQIHLLESLNVDKHRCQHQNVFSNHVFPRKNLNSFQYL